MAVPYKGVSFPFRFNSGGSTTMTELTPDDATLIKESLYQIWFTRKGERVMQPEFGTDYLFNFEAMEDITELSIQKDAMMKAAEEWEPRVSVKDITFEVHPDLESAYFINAEVLILKYQSTENLQMVYTPS